MTRASEPIRVRLEIDRSTDPLSGVTIDESGSSQPFTGWTGLTTSLMAAIDRARQPEPGTDHPERLRSPQ